MKGIKTENNHLDRNLTTHTHTARETQQTCAQLHIYTQKLVHTYLERVRMCVNEEPSMDGH